MSTKPLPEVTTLIEILAALKGLGGANAVIQQRPMLVQLASIYNTATGDEDDRALIGISQLLGAMEQLLPLVSPDPVRAVAAGTLRRLHGLFRPKYLHFQVGQYYNQAATDIDYVSETIGLFLATGFDFSQVIERQGEISTELNNLKDRIGKSDTISDAIRSVLIAQVDLIEKSMSRLQKSGVGPFRESIYSMYGRISIEIDKPSIGGSVDLRKIADDLLRIVGLVEAGGKLLQLAGIDPVKLLTGPSV